MSTVLWTARRLAALLDAGNVLCLADDDQHAEAITAALEALCPEHAVVWLPSSDALPGDGAPASPSNVGARVAALRALHCGGQGADSPHLVCVLSGEAAGQSYPTAETCGQAPLKIALGDAIDAGAFADQLKDIGYFADDRVDEPGELAVRGDVIDVFPANARGPARIEIADGVIVAI